MRKLSEEIGEKYIEWKDGDCIFISSPTGSGKTYFIINILRPFLIRQFSLLSGKMHSQMMTEGVEHRSLAAGALRLLKSSVYPRFQKNRRSALWQKPRIIKKSYI